MIENGNKKPNVKDSRAVDTSKQKSKVTEEALNYKRTVAPHKKTARPSSVTKA